LLTGESRYFDALQPKYETVLNLYDTRRNKKAKKSFCPHANTGNTHHGMRYAGSKLFSNVKVQKIAVNSTI